MRRVVIFFIMCIISFAQDFNEKLQEAIKLEKQNDINGAMRIYKELAVSAAKFMQDQTSVKNLKKSAHKKTAMLDLLERSGVEVYETNYILPVTYAKNVPKDDRKHFETKFQLSLKKPFDLPIINDKTKLYFAYSQTSWWQTARFSAPFRETNYRPEVFIDFTHPFDLMSWIKSISTGLLHESNGRDGINSRSWNRAYLKTSFEFDKLEITPRIWLPIGDLSDNKDLLDYVGYGDLSIKYDFDYAIAKLLFRNNLKPNSKNKGALQTELLFPVGSGINIYLQYFSGYSESLIDYNRHTDKIGIGFSIIK